MGITITAVNSKYEFDMGYGGFANLRKNIARSLDSEFGENYALITSCRTSEDFAKNDAKAEEIINRKHLDDKYSDVLDFLYMPNVEGGIPYTVCAKILELLINSPVDFSNKGFRYAAYRHNDYDEFKAFLAECVKERKDMEWF